MLRGDVEVLVGEGGSCGGGKQQKGGLGGRAALFKGGRRCGAVGESGAAPRDEEVGEGPGPIGRRLTVGAEVEAEVR
jgi:hypothetical protein